MSIPSTWNLPPPQILLLGTKGLLLRLEQHMQEAGGVVGVVGKVPSGGVTSMLTIPRGCGHTAARRRAAGTEAL